MGTWAGCEKGGSFTAMSSLGQCLQENFGTRSQLLSKMSWEKSQSWCLQGQERGSARPQARWGRTGQHIWAPAPRGQGPGSLLKMLINTCSGWDLMQDFLELHTLPFRNVGVMAWLWNPTVKQPNTLPVAGLKAGAGEERIANAPRNSLSAQGPWVCQLDPSSSLDWIH